MNKKPYLIAVIVKATNSDFWQTLLSGAKRYGSEHTDYINVKTYGPKEETDVDEQVEILNSVLTGKPDAVVIASTSNNLTVPAIEKAMNDGIPIITIDNRIQTDHISAFIATDNRKAAATAAENMVQTWKATGVNPSGKKYVVINSLKDSKVDEDRDYGFIDRMRELEPGIEMLDIQYMENSAEKTALTIQRLLEENRDLIGIFADNDQTGIGTARGIKNAEAGGRVLAYAFDASSEELNALEDGLLSGLVVQDPFAMGYQGVRCAVEAVEGTLMDRLIDTGATIVTKANLNEEKVKKLINPEE